MDRLIVTGGAGFIGSNFVRHVLRHGTRHVVVLDKLTYAGNRRSLADVDQDERFELVEGDIADGRLLAELFDRVKPTAVVNFAAETHVDRSIDSPRGFLDTNVVGAYELLEASRRCDVRGFRFVHVSTDEVYGSLGPEGLFREDTPYAPNSPYAASKAAADHLVRAWHRTFGVSAIVTNCSNNYGPYQFPEKLIPLMTLNALDGRELPIYGDGGNVRDWLYVEDHCEGIRLALERGTPGEAYNLGGDSEMTNVQVVDTICEALDQLRPAADGSSYKELKRFVKDRPGHDRRYAIDASKARRELGWEPRHDFASGILSTVRWFIDNRSWCDAVQADAGYTRERLGKGD